MEQLVKRQKVTKESTIHDIASYIRDISTTITSLSESYRALLKVNKAAVLYMQHAKKQQVPTVAETESDLEQTIEENQ